MHNSADDIVDKTTIDAEATAITAQLSAASAYMVGLLRLNTSQTWTMGYVVLQQQ